MTWGRWGLAASEDRFLQGNRLLDGYLEQLDTLDARQFVVAVKKLADSLNYGTDRSPFLGAGIEYVQSRAYEYGDPLRSIDWRVTARTGKLHVKEYEAPKSLPCYLLVDTSASMTISSQKLSKYALAIHVAGGIALACLGRVSPVGVVGAGAANIRVEPSLSQQQILQWLHRLRRFRYDEETTLVRRLIELQPSLMHRALVIVLTDLHEVGAIETMRRVQQQHDVVALQFQDPAEIQLRGSGLFRAREAETGHSFIAHGRQRWVNQEQVAERLKKSGIDHLLIRTDQPFAHQLRYFFSSRDLLGKGTR